MADIQTNFRHEFLHVTLQLGKLQSPDHYDHMIVVSGNLCHPAYPTYMWLRNSEKLFRLKVLIIGRLAMALETFNSILIFSLENRREFTHVRDKGSKCLPEQRNSDLSNLVNACSLPHIAQ